MGGGKSQLVPCLRSEFANYNPSAGSPPNKQGETCRDAEITQDSRRAHSSSYTCCCLHSHQGRSIWFPPWSCAPWFCVHWCGWLGSGGRRALGRRWRLGRWRLGQRRLARLRLSSLGSAASAAVLLLRRLGQGPRRLGWRRLRWLVIFGSKGCRRKSVSSKSQHTNRPPGDVRDTIDAHQAKFCARPAVVGRGFAVSCACTSPLTQLRYCWGGLSSITMVSGREREHANQTLETFRRVGISYLGDRGRSAGVLERNLDRSLETLLLFHGRSYVCRHYCLPHGALGCDCGHRDRSPFPSLARCRTRCPGAADTPIQARCLNRIAAAACAQRATR
jgi:hypothetical protein